jgi:hypothetical protein
MQSAKSTGYLHASYAASLSEWGTPRPLPSAAAWAIEREIPGTDRRDAAGCYPLMACGHWESLLDDLQSSGQRWVTFTAVPDPLGAPGEGELRRIFRDHILPFKTHYVAALEGWTGPTRAGHRAMVRSAARRLETDVAPARTELLEQWSQLYATLVARHRIQGLRAFSRASFAALFAVPGMHVARAVSGNETVAMSLWATHGEYGYYHLSASSARGYELSATYAMVDSAIRYLRGLGLTLLDLGGGAGVTGQDADGLGGFKRGWSTEERTAWLCGRILDPGAYRVLADGRTNQYFPAYRAGEFF